MNGALLVALRTRRGLSGNKLAAELGLNQSFYSQLERGERGASPETLTLLAEFYGLPAETLL